MSGNYRVELAVTGRAGCQATDCFKQKAKIAKGELRHGVSVLFQEHTSMKWRHWGCVTPVVIHKWNETCQGDMDLVDGYDELPKAAQEKVQRALANGHVDDEDWKGDIEMNRYGAATMRGGKFTSTTKAKVRQDVKVKDAAKASEEQPKPAAKKRSRKQMDDFDDDDDEDEEVVKKPAPKKARGKKAQAEAEDDPQPPPKRARGKKVKNEQEDDDDRPATPVPKKARARKAKTQDDEDDEDGDTPVPQKPKARQSKAAAKVEPSSSTDDLDADDSEHEPEPKAKAKKAPAKKATTKKPRAKKAAAEKWT